jgi:hypothetical protein
MMKMKTEDLMVEKGNDEDEDLMVEKDEVED